MKSQTENPETNEEEAETTFIRRSDRVERFLRKSILWLVLLAVAAQLALQSPVLRAWLTGLDKFEGTPFSG
jgi:hypothetical protein